MGIFGSGWSAGRQARAAFSLVRQPRPGGTGTVHFTGAQINALVKANVPASAIVRALRGTGQDPFQGYSATHAKENLNSYRATGRLVHKRWNQVRVPLAQRLMRGKLTANDNDRASYLARKAGVPTNMFGRVSNDARRRLQSQQWLMQELAANARAKRLGLQRDGRRPVSYQGGQFHTRAHLEEAERARRAYEEKQRRDYQAWVLGVQPTLRPPPQAAQQASAAAAAASAAASQASARANIPNENGNVFHDAEENVRGTQATLEGHLRAVRAATSAADKERLMEDLVAYMAQHGLSDVEYQEAVAATRGMPDRQQWAARMRRAVFGY